MAQRILSIFGVKDTRLLPEAIMQAVMNPNEEERRTIYCAPYAIADDHIKRVTDTFLLRLKEQRRATTLMTN